MDDIRTLFVGNLGPHITDALLRELFLQAGPIEKVRLARVNGVPKPFAHIVFHHECSVSYATKIFKGTKLHKRELLLQQNNASRDSGPNSYTPPHPSNLRDEDFSRGHYYHGDDSYQGNNSRNRWHDVPQRGSRYREGRDTPPAHDYPDDRNFSRRNRHHGDRDRSPPMESHFHDSRRRSPLQGNHHHGRNPAGGGRYSDRSTPPSHRNHFRRERNMSPPHRRDQHYDDPNDRRQDDRRRGRRERSPYGNPYGEDVGGSEILPRHYYRDDRNNWSSDRCHYK